MSKSTVTDSWWDNFKQIASAIILAIIIKTSVVEAYKIPSASMEDTLLVGDFLLANKFVYGAQLPFVSWRLPGYAEPERGDIIIFIFPGDGQTKYIKRCIGLPGDTIFIKDKQLFVNNEAVDLPEHGKFEKNQIIPRGPAGKGGRDNFGPYIVPADSYFMMGDNRDNSYDSRFWGPVPKQNVLGEAMMIHWSWDDTKYPSPDASVDDPMSVPRMFVYNAVHFFQKVRWGRLFNVIN